MTSKTALAKRLALLTLAIFGLAACASKPILIPNDKFKQAGRDVSERDIDQCIAEAEAQLEQTKDRRVLKSAATGAVIGGAIGALSGGSFVAQTLTGAAVGGGVGAVVGAASTPEEAKRGLVNYCLEQKGYHVAGWD